LAIKIELKLTTQNSPKKDFREKERAILNLRLAEINVNNNSNSKRPEIITKE